MQNLVDVGRDQHALGVKERNSGSDVIQDVEPGICKIHGPCWRVVEESIPNK
jgi:hypothetical protein